MVHSENIDTCFKHVGDYTTGNDGMVLFRHLTSDYEYRLVETKAPFGRIKPVGQWKVFLGEVHKIETIGSDTPDFVYQDGNLVVPNDLIQLPITGGSGIALYICVGWLLISFSIGILLLYYEKKRKKKLS